MAENETDLLAQLNEVVRAHVPQQLGEQLRQRLNKAESDAKELDRLRKEHNDLKQRNETSIEVLRQHAAINERTAVLQKLQNEVDAKLLKQEILELKAKYLEERVRDLKEVTLAVFSNNHFKYFENVNRQVIVPPNSSYPTTHNLNDSRSVDGVG